MNVAKNKLVQAWREGQATSLAT